MTFICVAIYILFYDEYQSSYLNMQGRLFLKKIIVGNAASLGSKFYLVLKNTNLAPCDNLLSHMDSIKFLKILHVKYFRKPLSRSYPIFITQTVKARKWRETR